MHDWCFSSEFFFMHACSSRPARKGGKAFSWKPKQPSHRKHSWVNIKGRPIPKKSGKLHAKMGTTVSRTAATKIPRNVSWMARFKPGQTIWGGSTTATSGKQPNPTAERSTGILHCTSWQQSGWRVGMKSWSTTAGIIGKAVNAPIKALSTTLQRTLPANETPANTSKHTSRNTNSSTYQGTM